MEAPTASTSTLAASASTVVKPSHLQPPKKRPEATTSSQRLEDLQDAEPGASRPNVSHSFSAIKGSSLTLDVQYNWWQLIRAAINSAQDERLTLQGVYDALMARYSCFADDDEIWKVRPTPMPSSTKLSPTCRTLFDTTSPSSRASFAISSRRKKAVFGESITTSIRAKVALDSASGSSFLPVNALRS